MSRDFAFTLRFPVTAAVLSVATLASPALAERVVEQSPRYQTNVEREVLGELNEENLRQASLLASQVLVHVFEASDAVADEQPELAREQLEHAHTLIGIMRELLPTTRVTTTVTDAAGREVYHYQAEEQGDLIPLYEDMAAVEVLELMTDAKAEEASVRGVRLADVDLIYTRALFDLSHVERRLNAATRALDAHSPNLADASRALRLAAADGVELIRTRTDSPLVEAAQALTLAERQAEADLDEAARENLRVARLSLETLRNLAPGHDTVEVRELERELERLSGDLSQEGMTDRIRALWHRVTGLIEKEPGEAVVTTESEPSDSPSS